MRALAARSEVSPMPDLSRRRELVREWLAKFAANHNRRMDGDSARAMLALWVEGFADVPATPRGDAMLQGAFRETLLRSEFFPSIAEIRSRFPAARAKIFSADAEYTRALPSADRRHHRCPEPVPLAQVAEAFRGVARALPPAETKEKPAPFTGFRFPVDLDHEKRVRRQAADILAGARA